MNKINEIIDNTYSANHEKNNFYNFVFDISSTLNIFGLIEEFDPS